MDPRSTRTKKRRKKTPCPSSSSSLTMPIRTTLSCSPMPQARRTSVLLVAYHVPTRRILDKNVRLQRLRSERLHQSVSVWLRGETSPPINWIDVMYMTPWTFISAALLLLYLGLRLVLGDQISLSHIWKQFT